MARKKAPKLVWGWGHYTIWDSTGRRATTYASSQLDAMLHAAAKWPDAKTWGAKAVKS